jgi:hypothetical protein
MSSTTDKPQTFEQSQGVSGQTRELAERGAPLPPAPEPGPPGSGSLTPNQSLFVVPHHEQFIAQWNTQSGVYRYTFDEALRHSRQNAVAYRLDPVVYEALRARQMPTAALSWHLEAENEADPGEADHAKKCREAIERTPNLQQLLMYLLDAVWYGRHGASLVYDWDFTAGYRRAVVRQHFPINGDKLVFRYTGEVGVLVGGKYSGSWIPTDRGRAHICTPEERQLLVVHEHEREDADFQAPEMAGRVHGVGVRDRLYWFLYMKQRVLAWMMSFLERVGKGGTWVFYFESGNDASLAEVTKFAQQANNNTAFLFPRYADGKSGPGVERLEPVLAGADMLYRLVTEYFDVVIRRLILGQSLSAEAGGTGLGSGVASFHEETLNRILKYDARNLQETLTRDFVSVISRHIDPARCTPKWVFEVDKPNSAEHLEAAGRFFEMGGILDEDNLRSVLGLPKPKPGSKTLSRAQSALEAANPMLGLMAAQNLEPGGAGPTGTAGPPSYRAVAQSQIQSPSMGQRPGGGMDPMLLSLMMGM